MDYIIEQIKNKILKEIDCDAIVLFGSYSRETQNNESDIDIAFKTKNSISKKDLFYLQQQLEDISKKDVDLINLDNIGDSFKYEILITGKVLYCKNELEFELYKLDVYREFLDLNESRMSIIERIKRGDTIYGK